MIEALVVPPMSAAAAVVAALPASACVRSDPLLDSRESILSKVTVKWNVEPQPTVLSNHSDPPLQKKKKKKLERNKGKD